LVLLSCIYWSMSSFNNTTDLHLRILQLKEKVDNLVVTTLLVFLKN